MPEVRWSAQSARTFHTVIGCAAVLAMTAVLAVTTHATAGSGGGHSSATVTPRLSYLIQPVHIRLRHLRPGPVEVHVTSVDANGTDWSSTARFAVGASGTLEVDDADATAGSYHGVHGMGLIWSMHPDSSPAGGAAYWWSSQPQRFELTARQNGDTVLSTAFYRSVRAPGVHVAAETTLARQGFIGRLWQPAGRVKKPAILAFGGSEGGLSGGLLSGSLAGLGYPTLNIAYFAAPGLPKTLSRIPLEYFARALRWLGRQPCVDPRHIYVLGISRGSEAAQLLGVHFPNLVHGVILGVPSNVSLCSYPGCTGPAWIMHGHALPYTSQFNDPHPTDDPAAVIPDERIRGPLFMVCGGADRVWNSCPYAQAIQERLRGRFGYAHDLITYRSAGHGVGGLIPYEPASATGPTAGDSPEANALALARLWPHLVDFLRR